MINNTWWTLPGPARFVDALLDDLQEGRNVIVRLPQLLPDGLKEAMNESLTECNISVLRASPGISPIKQVEVQYGLEGECKDIKSLASCRSLSGLIIWIEGVDSANRDEWVFFLTKYQHAVSAIQPHLRLRFCLPLIGEVAVNRIEPEVCLSVREWNNVLNFTDTLLHAARVITGAFSSPLQQRVAQSVVAKLSLWDYSLVHSFQGLTLDQIFSPQKVLAHVANSRGWNAKSYKPNWADGSLQEFEGKQRQHSCLITESALRRRIWSGQVSVLFPHVEEARQDILPDIRRYLKPPFQTNCGEIRDISELEISQIWYFLLKSEARVNPELTRKVSELKDVRNRLAHLEPLPADMIC